MSKAELLGELDLLVVFSPRLQAVTKLPMELPLGSARAWLSVQVFGTPGISDLTQKPIVEDMRIEVNGEDIESLLPDDIVNALANYVLDL